MPNISIRLQTIGEFVNKDAHVFDVGADHGLLEKYLIDNDVTKNIVAVENKVGPYSTLKNNLLGYNVKVLLSDGLDDLDSTSDTLIIAGMGGLLIKDIISKHVDKLIHINKIIVDAHRDIYLIREYITQLGFIIEKEKLVYENGQYYFVISFIKGHKEYSLDELMWGVNLLNKDLFKAYKESELDRLVNVLLKQKKAKIVDPKTIEEIENKIERLKNYEHN